MFVIDKNNNSLIKIETKTFTELGFSERKHLQEWLEKNPEALGEELLIIQKEFDGFNDTRERLDLLAIDKQGNLVVIENKLDDTGRDVTWQALKYASYVSSLTKTQIKEIYQAYLKKNNVDENAEENISDFLESGDFADLQLNQIQRIIMVAGKYRREVTSTVLWLVSKYGLNIKCLKATPYQYNDMLFLKIDQIIPVKEIEDYTIKMAEKEKEEQSIKEGLKARQQIRFEFWNELLKVMNSRSKLFRNVSPNKETWLTAGAGISGVAFNFVISNNGERVELYISRGSQMENKYIFDQLYNKKEEIEHITGPLIWQRLNDKKSSRIKKELNTGSIYDNKEQWDDIINKMVETMIAFEQAFKKPIQQISIKLRRLNKENTSDEPNTTTDQ